MKQLLLILFLLPFLAHTQTVVATDSSYSQYYGVEGLTTLDSVHNYQYDSACRKTMMQSLYPSPYQDSTGGTYFSDGRREFYTYYPNDSLYQILKQYRSDTLYRDADRITYTYNKRGQITTYLEEGSFDTLTIDWRPTLQINTTYNSTGNITDNVTKIYNYDLGRIVNSTESRFEYNERQQDTVALLLRWNLFTRAWVPESQVLSAYDNNGFLVKTTQQYWDVFSSLWTTESEMAYFNNSKGLPDSSIRMSFTDTNSIDKTYFLYDTVTSQLLQSTTYSYYDNEFFYGTRFKYIHSLSANVKGDTTISEISYTLGMPDNFVVNDQYALTYFYNSDGTIRERIESFDWSDFDIPVDYITRYSYKSCSSVLPVNLLSFTGSQTADDAILKWQTINEQNTAYFTLQRSTDGIHFIALGSVSAAGNTSATNSYSYTDRNITFLSASKLYYRLITTGKDGNLSYSKTVELNIATGKLTVRASPNPVKDVLNLYATATLPNAWIKVSDLSGRIVYAAKQNIIAGSAMQINMSSFTKGIYVVTVRTTTEDDQFKIVK